MSAMPNRPDSPARLGKRLSAAARGLLARRGPQSERLAIDALPDDLARLAPGSLYVVYAMPRSPGCEALIWESARAAHTRHVTVILACTHEETAARVKALGFVAGTPARGWPSHLSVLAMPSQGAAAANTPAFARLVGALRALKRFKPRAGALYFVEGAERWFNWGDPGVLAREGRLVADWCASRRLTLVLLVRPAPDARGDEDASERDEAFDDVIHSGRSEFHGACAGVARMRRTHGELLWYADFWRAGRALVTGEIHALRFTEHGRLTVAPEAADAAGVQAGARLAHDEERVVATRAVVANEAWVPREWEVVDDLAAALSACTHAVAATVVLDYTDGAGLEPLCAAVHRLRRQCGRALKIVVVERNQALRHQYELLLLSLGANMLLGRDLPFSRMQSLLRSLHGQLHTRPIANDYKTTLAAALTDAVRGYLPIATFCARVQEVLARGAMLALPHVLAKLTLLPDVAHVEALRSCMPRRAGDVFTADAGHLYVFLFACRLSDADASLSRIFDVPVERWFDSVVFLSDESIVREVRALTEANRRVPEADYSDLIGEAARAVSSRIARDGEPDGTARRANAQDVPAQVADAEAAVPYAAANTRTAEAMPVGTTAAQLRAVESMLARVSGTGAGPAPGRERSRRRFAEPCPMPLRATEEK